MRRVTARAMTNTIAPHIAGHFRDDVRRICAETCQPRIRKILPGPTGEAPRAAAWVRHGRAQPLVLIGPAPPSSRNAMNTGRVGSSGGIEYPFFWPTSGADQNCVSQPFQAISCSEYCERHCRFSQTPAAMPPVTRRVSPVTKRALVDARYSSASTISSSRPSS